ncbi:MAG: CaiB/BaiF CoA transferase family protein [Jhaorihella sp.]
MTQPLHGLRVVDLSELLPGPYAAKILGDLGASVVKIERPGGDGALSLSPTLYKVLNKGKDRQEIDLKSEMGRDAFKGIVAQADVLIEAYRPGVAARLGIDHETLLDLNPRLIYAAITGYGQTGPDAQRPGHDINYLARAGVLAISGQPDGAPGYDFGLPVADLAGSMFAVTSIMAAYIQRQETGLGQFLDVSISNSTAYWMTPRMGLFSGPEALDAREAKLAILSRPAYGIFETSDGAYITIAAVEDKFWTALVGILDLPFADDPRLGSYPERQTHAAEINSVIGARILKRPAAEWDGIFGSIDIPFALVQSPQDTEGPDNGGQAGSGAHYPVSMQGLRDDRSETPDRECDR